MDMAAVGLPVKERKAKADFDGFLESNGIAT
jgi:hypothetical protein